MIIEIEYIVDKNRDIRVVLSKGQHIIWNRDGIYKLIPQPVIENKIRNETIEATFRWYEGYPIPPTIARLLVGDN